MWIGAWGRGEGGGGCRLRDGPCWRVPGRRGGPSLVCSRAQLIVRTLVGVIFATLAKRAAVLLYMLVGDPACHHGGPCAGGKVVV